MTVSIDFSGTLTLDQSAGIQNPENDDVEVISTPVVGLNNDTLSGDLDNAFEAFLTGLPQITDEERAYAALVEGASDPGFVTITATDNEHIGKLFFSDVNGEDFDGDLVPGITTLSDQPLYFWSVLNGKGVIATTGGANDTVVAAFYITPDNPEHTEATVQVITFQSLKHPDTGDDDDTVDFSDVLNVAAVITKDIGDVIGVDDDGPTIVISGNGPDLVVDETVLATDDTESFASAFTPDFGTDGPGNIHYTLSGIGGPSGLVDTATGEDVILSDVGSTTVEGRTSGTNELVFRVSVNFLTGEVTLNQERAVVHPTDDPNEPITLAADNLVQLIATITDADGDDEDAIQPIGQNLVFLDDGPSISKIAAPDALTVDETDLTTDASASFADNFSSAFGADDAGTLVYALGVVPGASGLVDTATNEAVNLSLNGGVVEGRTSGTNDLVFTVTVTAAGLVTLDQLRAVVHPNQSDPDDNTSLSSADLVTLTATITDKDGDHQAATLDIGQALNFEDDGPSIDATSDSVILTVDETVLAIDDTDSFAAEFTSDFGEDGAGTIAYALSVVDGSSSGLFDTLSGEEIILTKVGDDIQGVTDISGDIVFVVSVNSTTGDVTLDQQRAVVHPNPLDPDEPISLASDDLIKLTATITDGDGDQDEAVENIGQNLVFEDDGPTAPELEALTALVHDETAGPQFDTDVAVVSNPVIAGLLANAGVAIGFAESLAPLVSQSGGLFGNDGPAAPPDAVTFALSVVDGTASALSTTEGTQVFLYNGTGLLDGLILGRVGIEGGVLDTADPAGDIAFALAVDENGKGYIAQRFSLNHPNASDDDDQITLAGDAMQLTVTLQDGDGDTASRTVDVGNLFSFQDDGPTAQLAFTENSAVLDESLGADLADPNADSDDITISNPDPFSGDYGAPIGAVNDVLLVSPTTTTGEDDENATVDVTLDIVGGAGTSSGLFTTAGTEVFLFNEAGRVVGRETGALGAVAFAVSINDLGEVSVAQYLSLNHPDSPNNYDEAVNLADLINATVTVTDGDLDVASDTVEIGHLISFEDDGPSASIELAGPAVAHDETAGVQPDANDTLNPAVAALFAGVLLPSIDIAPTGFAQSAAPVVSATSDVGEDNEGSSVVVSLEVSAAGVDSGLNTTDGFDVLLYKEGNLVVGRVSGGADNGNAAFAVAIDASGTVSVAQYASLQQPNAADPDDSVSIDTSALLAKVTVTDGDGDVAVSSVDIGDQVQFQDDGPTVAVLETGQVVAHDETPLVQGDANDTLNPAVAALFAGVGDPSTDLAVAGYAQNPLAIVTLAGGSTVGQDEEGATTTFSLDVSAAGVDSGLDTTEGTSIFLFKEGNLVVGRIGGALGAAAFAVAINATTGVASLAQYSSLKHPNIALPDETITITDSALLAKVTVTDGDGDTAIGSVQIGNDIQFQDDAPTITVAAASLLLDNTVVPVTGIAAFGYDIGVDDHKSYAGTESDFVDASVAAGVQLALTGKMGGLDGFVNNVGDTNITNTHVDRTSEDATDATFHFTFDYDGNPAQAGVQLVTASGDLHFDKVADTYDVTLDNPIEGFSFTFLHTTNFLDKNPTGNSGHPEIVIEKLAEDKVSTPGIDEDFYVQFSADSGVMGFGPTGDNHPTPADKAYTPGVAHDLVSGTETWVSATQTTNGVEGDTIQKNELLTLRFFNSNILSDANPPNGPGVEKVDPTATTDGLVLRFDGIGAGEDLIVFVDLKDSVTGTEITRAIRVDNVDFYKTQASIPDPYKPLVPLDNNDGMIIIEKNDYNQVGENFEIQGVQIMQSANGLTVNTAQVGSGINLNRATGDLGGSNVATAQQNWGTDNDNDVLKITDIGFVATDQGTQDADLHFTFQLVDGDGDKTVVQDLHVVIDPPLLHA